MKKQEREYWEKVAEYCAKVCSYDQKYGEKLILIAIERALVRKLS